MNNQDMCSLFRSERGISLLTTLFAMLLLSVIGLGMMFSTNMETMINANYRDKQLAVYASMSGLQEARDRIQLSNPDIVPPTELPDLAAANVIYIINPKGGETIEPWVVDSKYGDVELCQENVLGLSGPRGVPCTTIAAGVNWYSVVDNSDVANTPWNLTSPTDLKWTRITVKGNNMTATAVNGDAGNSALTCYDGRNQIPLPVGYGPDCHPDGSIKTLTLTGSGTGYTSAPVATIDPPPAGGVQATATVDYTTVPSGKLAYITMTTGGTGYTSPPQVIITDPGGIGTGAAAVATIIPDGNSVASLTFTGSGTKCYAVPPTVSISGGGGSGAVAVPVMGPESCIATWTPSGACKPHKNETVQVGAVGGGGNGFLGQMHFQNGNPWTADSISIINSGTGYTSVPTGLSFPAPDCPGVTLTANLGKRVTGVNLLHGGGGFTSVPTVTFGGVGSGTADTPPTATATLGSPNPDAGKVMFVTVTAQGSGYTAVSVAFSGGTAGVPAVATGTIGTINTITGITLVDRGKGYLTDPAVTIAGGGGAGASATALVARGPTYGRVFLVTTLAETKSGARAMSQMEVSSPVLGFALTGALTLDGPNPVLEDMPNSSIYMIKGEDANSCGETPEENHPAIGGYDDPNAMPATNSVQDIIDALPKPENYTGEGGTPSVKNVFGALGETMQTPAGLKALIEAVKSVGTVYPSGHTLTDNQDGEENNPAIVYIDGDLTYAGDDGVGILVVTGRLRMNGDFSWKGLVFVVGDGEAEFDGGGNGLITGSMLVANIWDKTNPSQLLPSLGSPFIDWNGGGGNGIRYDHCWADKMMHHIPFVPPPSTKPLKVLSIRALP